MAVIREIARTYLGAGCRTVEALGDRVVLKHGCPKYAYDGGQNKNEADAWAAMKDEPNITDILAPVLDSDPRGTWLLMPKLDHDTIVSGDEMYKLERALGRLGMSSADVKQANVGYNAHGKAVMTDYGINYGSHINGKVGQRCGKSTCTPCVVRRRNPY